MSLRAYRQAAGLTQKQLAVRVGCDQSEISRLERGKRLMSVPMLKMLAHALHVPPAALLADDNEVA